MVEGLTILPANHLLEVTAHLHLRDSLQPWHQVRAEIPEDRPQLNDVIGQQYAKRALEIAAIGKHCRSSLFTQWRVKVCATEFGVDPFDLPITPLHPLRWSAVVAPPSQGKFHWPTLGFCSSTDYQSFQEVS